MARGVGRAVSEGAEAIEGGEQERRLAYKHEGLLRLLLPMKATIAHSTICSWRDALFLSALGNMWWGTRVMVLLGLAPGNLIVDSKLNRRGRSRQK